jgi:hypothetical protein
MQTKNKAAAISAPVCKYFIENYSVNSFTFAVLSQSRSMVTVACLVENYLIR